MVTNMSSDENQKILGYCVRCGRKKTLQVKSIISLQVQET